MKTAIGILVWLLFAGAGYGLIKYGRYQLLKVVGWVMVVFIVAGAFWSVMGFFR